ncbi:GPALPP motifs-containing protein 1, partial [Manacus vitellinus]
VAGPALPPGYKSSCSSETPDSEDDSESLPLPRNANRDSEEETEGDPASKKPKRILEDDDDDGFFGPALPPGFKKQDDSPERPIIGPALPPGFKRPSEDTRSSKCFIGPSVSSELSPQVCKNRSLLFSNVPASAPLLMGEQNDSNVSQIFTSLKMFIIGSINLDKIAHIFCSMCAKFMILYPVTKLSSFSRIFSLPHFNLYIQVFYMLFIFCNSLLPLLSSHYFQESKRSESLMDIHQKKLKSKASEEKTKPQERRPFDRDQDLKVNRFDEAQKKALIRKSRDLNSKFEHSKGNMFL